jgi:predicted  nucleic acid-binding Zn-ribbon protein
VHPDVAALLAVQDDDIIIHDIETTLAGLRPRLDAMAAERDRAVSSREQARKIAASEERRRQEVAARVSQHRAIFEKNQAALNHVTSMREAPAATAQIEQAKRMIDEDELELASIGRHLAEANRLVSERERIASELDGVQAQARDSLAADQARLEDSLRAARAVRDEKAKKVPRALLSKYDRIRSRKRVHAVFALRGGSCGHCDTTIPMQRRSIMLTTGAPEICEGCGMMVYVTE